jgi:ABC-type branched-subunit amino acid transport system substrate-binding protein
MLRRLPAIALALLLLGASCSTSPERPDGAQPAMPGGPTQPQAQPEAVSPRGNVPAAEAKAYREILALYSAANYEPALARIAAFEQRHPKSLLYPQILNIRGMCLLLSHRPADAIPAFRTAIDRSSPGGPFAQYVTYNLASAQLEADQVPAARATAAAIRMETLDRENRIKVHYLRARIFVRDGQPADGARECLAASRLFADFQIRDAKTTRAAFAQALEASLAQVNDPAALEELFRTFEDTTLADAVLFRLGALEISQGKRDAGQSHLRTLMARYPQSPYYARASELARPPIDLAHVDPTAVGVLLPLKGRFARLGQRNLMAIQLAFGIYAPGGEGKHPEATLVVEDSGEEPEQALRALELLVSKHHVVAVIGPLLSKGIDQVTQRAQELGVPLVTLTRYPGVPGEFVLPAGLTLQAQATALAHHSVQKLGLKSFAVLYPRDKTGQESTGYFWDAVEEADGRVTGAEAYNPGETDFKQPVDRLSGLYYTEARARELEALAKERELNKIKKRTRKTEQYFSLKPVVDYQAVFIPEEPRVAGQILPMFAYRDVEKVLFLGTSAWNSQEFVTRAGPSAESSVFVDAWTPEDETPVAQAFLRDFRAAYGAEPSALDAIAYDAGKLVAHALPGGPAGPVENSGARAQVKDSLRSTRSLSGATGRITVVDGQVSRELKFLTVRAGKIVRAPDASTVSAR